MAKTEHRQRSLALYETILKLKDLDECCKFFDDLCTPTELRSMEQRFDVAVYLQQGLVYLKFLDKPASDTLYRAIVLLQTEEECRNFLQDLCTVSELKAMEQRMEVAMLLDDGLIYSDILERTGASSATISRVRRSMLDNGAGGVMETVIRREGLGQKKEST